MQCQIKKQGWDVQLAALSPEIHVSFSLQRQKYWLAEWSSDGKRFHLYIGVTSPQDHPCFSKACNHPPAKPRPKPGYQPSEETRQRLREAHIGKRLSEQHRQSLSKAKQRHDRISGYIPPYLQIAEQIKEQIFLGHWQVGQRLPSLAKAAERYNVDEATISKAYHVLAEGQLVVIQPGQGTFVGTLAKEL